MSTVVVALLYLLSDVPRLLSQNSALRVKVGLGDAVFYGKSLWRRQGEETASEKPSLSKE